MKKAIFLILIFLLTSTLCPAQTHDDILEKGIEQYKGKLYRQAISTLSGLIDQDGENVGAFRIRGSSYMMLEKYDDAIKDFETAARLSPESYGVHSDLGAAWYQKQDYEKALEYYNKEVEKSEDNHLLYFNRALCFEQLGDIDRALEDLNTSLGMKSDFYWALCYKANLLIKKGRHDEAAGLYQKAVRIDPEKEYAKQKLAELEKTKKDTRRAETRQKPAMDKPGFSLQSGAFKNRENARRLKEKLEENGYESRVLVLTDSKNLPWYLVRSGEYPDKRAAERAALGLKEKLGIKALIRPVNGW